MTEDAYTFIMRQVNEVLGDTSTQPTKEQKVDELVVHYNSVLLDMDDEELENEYQDKIGGV